MSTSPASAPPLVLDTNIVLDLWLYNDPATRGLRAALACGHWRWIATPAMREELRRVLQYDHIAQRLMANQNNAQVEHLNAASSEALLSLFDAHVCLVEVAAKIAFVCKDEDDQKFIDLAAAHQATLLSKDKAVLTMKKRLAKLGVFCGKTLPE